MAGSYIRVPTAVTVTLAVARLPWKHDGYNIMCMRTIINVRAGYDDDNAMIVIIIIIWRVILLCALATTYRPIKNWTDDRERESGPGANIVRKR